jgi:hypothetical protein
MLNKELINYSNKLYWVYRKVKQHQVNPEKINDLREYWMCDLVVKHRNQQDELLIFLKEISDVELVN